MKKKDHSLLFIFITIFIDITGLGIIIPVIPALISELIDGSISEAAKYSGWLMFSYASLQFLFAPILGGLSDQFGRRPVILLSLFGFGINYLVLAFAPTITWLFFGRVFQGIMGASLTTASAYIADISSPEKKAQNFGLIGAYHDYLMGFYQVAKYYYYPGWHEPGGVLEMIVNKDKFSELPSDLQEIIKKGIESLNIWMQCEFDSKNSIYLNKLLNEEKCSVKTISKRCS